MAKQPAIKTPQQLGAAADAISASIGPRVLGTISHREGFCLMKYRGATSGRVVWIWNSRDGVTPFSTTLSLQPQMLGTAELYQHVDWFEDVCVPNWVPRIGDYIWASLTKEAALRMAKSATAALVNKHPGCMDDEEAEEDTALRLQSFKVGIDPMLVVVDQAIHERFRLEAELTPWVLGN